MSKTRRAGTDFENRVAAHGQAAGRPWERNDTYSPLGDIDGEPGWTLEAKIWAQSHLASWMDQARKAAERRHHQWFAVIHNRKNHPIRRAFVTMELDVFLEVLDQLREKL